MLEQHPALALSTLVALFSLGNLLRITGIVFLAAAVLVLGQVFGGVVTYLAPAGFSQPGVVGSAEGVWSAVVRYSRLNFLPLRTLS